MMEMLGGTLFKNDFYVTEKDKFIFMEIHYLL